MAINPVCDKCGKELQEFGAILLSPPNKHNEVQKFHFCKACFQQLAKDFR